MIEIRGRYNTALCYACALEKEGRRADPNGLRSGRSSPDAGSTLCRMSTPERSRTIGTTMTISRQGRAGHGRRDIGRGMETVRLAEREIDFAALDALIRREVPSGRNVRGEGAPVQRGDRPFLSFAARTASRSTGRGAASARSAAATTSSRSDRAENGALYLVVHSGSRYLGTQVCAATIRSRDSLPLRRGAQERVNALIAEYAPRDGAGDPLGAQRAGRRARETHPKDLALCGRGAV